MNLEKNTPETECLRLTGQLQAYIDGLFPGDPNDNTAIVNYRPASDPHAAAHVLIPYKQEADYNSPIPRARYGVAREGDDRLSVSWLAGEAALEFGDGPPRPADAHALGELVHMLNNGVVRDDGERQTQPPESRLKRAGQRIGQVLSGLGRMFDRLDLDDTSD